MSKAIDQHTDVDKRIRDFVERKSAPWYSIGQSILDKLSYSMSTRAAKNKDIGYESLQWKRANSR